MKDGVLLEARFVDVNLNTLAILIWLVDRQTADRIILQNLE